MHCPSAVATHYASSGARSEAAKPSKISCSLTNSGLTAADFDNIPYMALKGDYTATSTVCQETVDAINARRAAKQGTAKAEYLKLDDMGILGVTHMMMLDKKNLEIADIMMGWVEKNVKGSSSRR